jgi:uncharacterized protein
MSQFLYYGLSIFGLFLAIGASIWTKLAFGWYKKRPASRPITPVQLAEEIIRGEDLDVTISIIPGEMNDHYDPYKKVVALGEGSVGTSGMSQLAVTAHEFGHAMQDKTGGILFKIRNLIAPLVGFGTSVGYILFILGFALSFFQLAYIGLILFSLTTVFMMITLPIEIDASIRAMRLLRKYNVVNDFEASAARNLLTAAASTYMAGFLQSFLQLLYFASLLSGRGRN